VREGPGILATSGGGIARADHRKLGKREHRSFPDYEQGDGWIGNLPQQPRIVLIEPSQQLAAGFIEPGEVRRQLFLVGFGAQCRKRLGRVGE
jgi:hypothetical protein